MCEEWGLKETIQWGGGERREKERERDVLFKKCIQVLYQLFCSHMSVSCYKSPPFCCIWHLISHRHERLLLLADGLTSLEGGFTVSLQSMTSTSMAQHQPIRWKKGTYLTLMYNASTLAFFIFLLSARVLVSWLHWHPSWVFPYKEHFYNRVYTMKNNQEKMWILKIKAVLIDYLATRGHLNKLCQFVLVNLSFFAYTKNT